jgi:hypothetical protein
MKSSLKSSLIGEADALSKGIDFLNKPSIAFNGGNVTGYEYKKWIPLWIPFIQYSTGIWKEVTTTPDTITAWQGGAEHIPFNQFIAAGSAFDFQVITPRDHPFLLIDLKVSCEIRRVFDDDPEFLDLQSRFKGPYDSTNPLFRKYAYPNNEGIEISLTAVSPGGKPVFGGLQNTTGLDSGVRTIGPTPHIQRLSLSENQCMHSGRGALQHHLLFPVEGIIRVTVENRNPNLSFDPDIPDGAFINGVAFGYVIME